MKAKSYTFCLNTVLGAACTCFWWAIASFTSDTKFNLLVCFIASNVGVWLGEFLQKMSRRKEGE